jgi:non-heme chloroperoxidase
MIPPVIFIHGAFCTPSTMDPLRNWFAARGYDTHAPALRHHAIVPGARAPVDLGATSLLDYADDLERFIGTLPARPVIIGHSMGGLLAQMLGARGCAAALALLAPSPPWGVLPTSPFELASAIGLFHHAGPTWGRAIEPDFGLAAAHALDRLDAAAQRAAFAQFVPESGRALAEMMAWGLDPARAAQVHARDVTVPVLAIAGGRDRINPPATVRLIARRYRGAYRCFEDMSHWLIGEPDWPELAHAMDAFISQATSDRERAAE